MSPNKALLSDKFSAALQIFRRARRSSKKDFIIVKWFNCLILVENFPGELIKEKSRVGFYTTRFVQANSRKIKE